MSSQHYEFAGGIRYDNAFGLSFSQRVYESFSLEQNILAENEKFNYSIFLLVRKHEPLVTKRLNWYYGGGPGLIRLKETLDLPPKTTPALSLQTGIEFNIKRLVLSGAVEPVFYSSREDFKFNMNSVISAKYAFIPKKKPPKPTFKERVFGKPSDKKKENGRKSDKKTSTKSSTKSEKQAQQEPEKEKRTLRDVFSGQRNDKAPVKDNKIVNEEAEKRKWWQIWKKK